LTTPRIPKNLLRNPGGESGDLSSWNQIGPSNAEIDSNARFLSSYYPFSGNYCFVGGNVTSGSFSSLFQNIDLLSGLQNVTPAELDSNTLKVNVSFHYQAYDDHVNPPDFPQVSLIFKNVNYAQISTENTSVLTCATSPSRWCNYLAQYPLPVTTRSIDYTMAFFLGIGNRIGAYIDDNSLMIV
jgi:hypothetical protein